MTMVGSVRGIVGDDVVIGAADHQHVAGTRAPAGLGRAGARARPCRGSRPDGEWRFVLDRSAQGGSSTTFIRKAAAGPGAVEEGRERSIAISRRR